MIYKKIKFSINYNKLYKLIQSKVPITAITNLIKQ